MSNDNLYARFAANWRGDDVFLTSPEGGRLTYAALDAYSAQVAEALVSLGVRVDDRVSVQAGKSVDFVLLYLGCLRGGFVFHPLNPAYTRAELDYFFADAEPALIVCDPDNPSQAADAGTALGVHNILTMCGDGSGTFRDAYRQASGDRPVLARNDDDLAALLYSSGTTGQPKGIPLTHANIGTNAYELSAAWGFRRDDVLLHALPMFHTHGLFIALTCTLMSGSTVRYLSRFDAEVVIDELAQATVMMGVPTYYTRLLANPHFDAGVCGGVRLFTSGSAPLREDTFHEFTARTGQTIVERYGMTETVVLTTNPLDGERRAGTVGLPLPSVELRIADDRDAPLPAGEVGRIQVRGPNVFHEYWRKPDKTAEDFTADGFFNTGDQGRIDDDYVSIVGRAKDLIISGGLNVYPIEVEQVLNECEGVREAAVIGVPHADFGEAVVAVCIGDAEALDEARVQQFARERLAAFKLPKRVITVADLPRNAMGKVQKNLLRERFEALFSEP
ncbi:MAG: AMP-binding protein [Gammaproteobacteria bacterium]|jgi:malonyl-CoA/methylmalonyl-CoA synthetase